MKSRMKSDARRASIVNSAIHLFAEKGFRGTTTRELAALLGVTEPVLYQHFETKNDLYAAIIEAKAEQGRQSAAGFLEHLEGSDDRALFTHVAELVLASHEEDPEFHRLLLFSALERHELAERFFESQAICFHEMVTGYIRRRIREGAFRAVNPRIAAYSFIGMVTQFGLVQVLFGHRPVTVGRKKLIGEIVSIFLNGVALPSHGGCQ